MRISTRTISPSNVKRLLKRGIDVTKEEFLKKGIFSRLFTSYILILLIPIIISWVAYDQAIKETETYTRASNVQMLKHSSKIIENYMEEVNRTAIQLGMNQRLKDLLGAKTIDNYELSLFLDEIVHYGLTNSLASESCIYMRNSDKIIFDNTVYDAEFFFKYIFNYQGRSFAQWKELLFSKTYNGEYLPASKIRMERINFSLILYLQSVPIGIQKYPDGVIMFMIDVNKIHSLLPEIDVKSNNWFYMSDATGKILTSIGSIIPPSQINLEGSDGYIEKNYQGNSVFVTHITSDNGNWKYIMGLPRRIVMAKVRYIKIITWAVTLVSLLGGFIGACYLTKRNAAPIRGMVKQVTEFFGDNEKFGGDFEFLSGKINELISNNNMLQTDMQRQSEMATATFFDRLLKGEFKSNDEIEAFSRYVGVDFSGKRFLVVIVKMYRSSQLLTEDILKEMDMTKVLVKDMLRQVLKEDAYHHDLDENNIAVLLALPQVEEDSYAIAGNLINQIYFEVYSRYQIRLKFAAGDFCEHILDISQSFEQARDAKGYFGRSKGQKLVWYRDLPKKSEAYYYSIDLETRMMNAVKAGDYNEVERYLKILMEENYEKRTLTPEMLNQLSWELRGTLMKLRDQMELHEAIAAQIDKFNTSTKSFEEAYEDLVSIFESICEWVDNRKRSHNSDLKDRMVDLLEKTYQDPGLSLSAVAEKFNLTESYISQFFKEQAGQNFSSYLEKIRMGHACELLTETDMPINEIAKSVGYYSDQVFRRAFKRYHGTTPNEFRLLLKSNELDFV